MKVLINRRVRKMNELKVNFKRYSVVRESNEI
jgi:hypothetical protein